jgi:hypothetical protein
MTYVLNNKDGVHLRAFHSNDIPGVFSFSNSNYFTYRTEQEAKEHIEFIISEVNKPDNQKRYGKYATIHKRIASQLTIGFDN